MPKNLINNDPFLLRSLMSFHLQPPDALYSFNCCYMDSWRENWLQVQTTFSPLIYSLASPPLQTLLVSSPAPSEHILVPPRKTSQFLFHVLYSQSLINNFHKNFLWISTSTTKSISSLFLHALSLLTATCKKTNDQQKTK